MAPAESEFASAHPAAPAGSSHARPWPGRHVRLVGIFMLLPAAAVLVIAALLNPDVRGYDTHVQLGLPPCGFMQTTGLPCMTCGMTTAFANMAHGQVLAAIRVQAFGTVLFVLTVLAALVGAGQLFGGWDILSRLHPRMWWLWALWPARSAAGR